MTPKDDPPRPPRLELRLTSDPAQVAAARHAVEAFCTAAGLDTHDADEMGLCVNEALANVIRHAYGDVGGQPILLAAEQTGIDMAGALDRPSAAPAVHVTIRDWGDGQNPSGLLLKPHHPLEPSGLGLVCLRQLLDEVVYITQPDGMLLSMTRTRREPRKR